MSIDNNGTSLNTIVQLLNSPDNSARMCAAVAIKDLPEQVTPEIWDAEKIWSTAMEDQISEVRIAAGQILRRMILDKGQAKPSHLRQQVEQITEALLALVSGPEAANYESAQAIGSFIYQNVGKEDLPLPKPKLPPSPPSKPKPKARYYSVKNVLKELQIEENELQRLVAEGEIRAFRDEAQLKFAKSDIDRFKKERMTEPTILLPSEKPDADSGVLLVEEDTSESLIDIDDLEGLEPSTVPTVDFKSGKFEEISGAITEELTFEEDSDSSILEAADDVLIDSSEKLPSVEEHRVSRISLAKDMEAEDKPVDIVAKKPRLKKEAKRKEIIELEREQEKFLPTRERKIPNFEKALSDDAGNPGPIERLFAQSVLMMKAIQLTIGLKFILLANACDILLENITGYIHGIFRAWKMSKTIHRRIKCHIAGDQVQAVIDDVIRSRLQLSRLFSFAGFYLEDYHYILPDSQQWKDIGHSTFAVKLAIEIRGHLDEMKRDLSLINVSEAVTLVKNSLVDFLLSFVPNPVEIFAGWKDVVLLAFFMRYSRQQIEEMYVDFVLSYRRLIELLQKNCDCPIVSQWSYAYLDLLDYEQSLLQRVGIEDDTRGDLRIAIATSRCKLQRLLQMLCNPEQFIEPRKWSRIDVVREVAKSKLLGKPNIHCVLELERWLSGEVARVLTQKGHKLDIMERSRRKLEAKNFRRRYQLQRKLRSRFLL